MSRTDPPAALAHPPAALPVPATPPAARRALAGLSLAMLMASLGTSIANVGLPALGEAFAAGFAALQWVVLAYLLAITALVVGAGRLGDMVGRQRLLLAGIALFTAASVLAGLAPTLGLLIAARAVQGLGAAVMLALSLALAGEAVPKARTGMAMGLLGSMSAIGTALGPSLGGVLLDSLGWRALFLVNLPLGLLALALAWDGRAADRPAARDGQAGFDWPGTLLLALALAAHALAMTAGGVGGLPKLLLLGAALVAGGLFLRAQRRARAPLLDLAALRAPGLGAGLATTALVATVMMATLVVGPFHLARGLGLAPAAVGLAMSVGPLVAALAGMPAGRLVDRFGARGMGALGLGGMAAGAGALALAPGWTGIAGYVAPLAVLTAGYALVQAATTTAVMAGPGSARRGVTAGLLTLARNVGLVTGAAGLGAVFAGAAGGADIMAATAEAVATGTRVTFGVAAGLVLLALGIAVLANRAGWRPAAAGGER